jgi:hypothetical protein
MTFATNGSITQHIMQQTQGVQALGTSRDLARLEPMQNLQCQLLCQRAKQQTHKLDENI